MARAKVRKDHLGVDTNVLVAYLDADHPAHGRTTRLQDEAVALNPTIIHEAYHTLVYKMKWVPHDASRVLVEAMSDERTLFVNQTLRTTKAGLRIALDYGLGGRDSLILANLLTAGIRGVVTLDGELIALGRVRHGRATLNISSL